ncbi:hypothetical protein DBV39_02835 [Orrella marina]|uniref:Uncharacterized protein n=1 Tax=Orrella marina TaxID=2163011 RepID=A0A2R4XGI9_9BURK|nr:hypothetical protein DBV39_02835 [Orrella marina]
MYDAFRMRSGISHSLMFLQGSVSNLLKVDAVTFQETGFLRCLADLSRQVRALQTAVGRLKVRHCSFVSARRPG